VVRRPTLDVRNLAAEAAAAETMKENDMASYDTSTNAPTPNKDRLRMWTRALKSGQYRQGKGEMRMDGHYCCLGVAMDIAFANGCKPTDTDNWGATSQMPDNVADWYGLSRGDGSDPRLAEVGTHVRGRARASSLNDAKAPFSDIADRIIYAYRLDVDN
jgi:hypothetical protein